MEKASWGYLVILFEMYVLVRKFIWEPIDYSENIVKQIEPDMISTFGEKTMNATN